MAIGIVDSPIKMVIFHRYVNVYQRVYIINYIIFGFTTLALFEHGVPLNHQMVWKVIVPTEIAIHRSEFPIVGQTHLIYVHW